MNQVELRDFYQNELHNDVIPFWQKYCVDYENGGYYTCVNRKGEIYNYEKSGWFQGRYLYILSKMLNRYGENEELAKAADCGFEFLKKCFLPTGRLPFVVTKDAKPVIVRRAGYYASELFAAMAFAEYYKYSKNEEALKLMRSTYDTICKVCRGEIVGIPKINPETVQMKSFSMPMCLLNLSLILKECDPERAEHYEKEIDGYLKDMKAFIHPECKCAFENVAPDGSRLEGPRGRLVNPGHSIEAAWFVMDAAEQRQDKELMKTALDLLEWSFELGWDKEKGGIKYFHDIENQPLEQLEWDLRLWWPHCETLIASIKAYRITGEEKYLEMFKMVHEYTFKHFKDNEFGEWFGYVRHDGSLNSELKGSLWKGPFHIPRCLMEVSEEINKIIEQGKKFEI